MANTISVSKILNLKNPKLACLETCSAIEQLKKIHGHMFRVGLVEDTFCVSRLLVFCATHENGCLDYANRVFSQIKTPNAFVYNAMIRGHACGKKPESSVGFYRQLVKQGLRPDNLTFPFLVKSCTRLQCLELGTEVHGQVIRRGFEFDAYVQNSLVHMYASCGDLETARKLFEKIQHLDIVSWSSMISGYNRFGDVESARELFDKMPERNIVTWSIMVAGYAHNGRFDKALEIFQLLQEEYVQANEAVMASVIASCGHLGALEQGKEAHDYVIRNKLTVTLNLGTSLVYMYARCGSIDRALQVFHDMPEQDALSWTAMLSGLAMHGHARRAIEYFYEMLRAGLRPRDVTFTAVLSACSHGGLVDSGFKLFESMKKEYSVEPRMEHYGCMVDLLGRAGKLDEAERFIHSMPVEPSAPIWGALLGACRIHRNARMGEKAGKKLLELMPNHSGYYVLLSNICARANQWDDVIKLREKMKEIGVKKSPGFSLIELNGVVHRFTIGDETHPEFSKIKATWEEIVHRIRAAGYVEDTSDVLFDIDDEERGSSLSRHSEKLAIAFGLMRSGKGTPIRIVKNLRVCEDCHTASKFVTKVFERELIMRDRNRFHHFKDGACSCMDYW
ncbi:unnamed protein product [Victoria cruziana]